MAQVLFLAIAILISCTFSFARGDAVLVHLKKTDDGWQLQRAGKEYFIQGAGGDASKKLLAECGGNSFRTWGVDHLDKELDEAQRLGLTVTVGIWLGHECHGFHYNNAEQVAEQLERSRQAILKYKDHPAVLTWALGNEMEGYEKGDNVAIWAAVQNLAALAHQLDPNHPTMTVVAEIGGDRVKNIHALCPDIDIVGINSYGGGASVAKRYRDAGGTKPFILTEFGPPGAWEVGKNAWGAPIELTSTAKGERYRNTYQRSILAEKEKLCLGSYVFAWGNKQEATATWFGLFLPDGARLEGVDVMRELWTGRKPANRCPQIASLKVNGKDRVEAGGIIHVALDVSDPENDAIKVRWELHQDPAIYNTGGDAQEVPKSFPDAIVQSDAHHADISMPAESGGYWLYAYVYDDHDGAAVADVPLYVERR